MIWVALGARLGGKIGDNKNKQWKSLGSRWEGKRGKNTKEAHLYMNFSSLGSPP